jgi:hypothetical protein
MYIFLKGFLLGIINIGLFFLFYYLDLLPSERFTLTLFSFIIFFLVTLYCINFYFSKTRIGFFKSIGIFFTILSISSFLCIGFDYWFNKCYDTEYKYILAKERMEEINKRRDRNGVGVYENFNPDIVDKKHDLESYIETFCNSLVLNLFASLLIFPLGLVYNKIKN